MSGEGAHCAATARAADRRKLLKGESGAWDVYIGTAEELIDAGLVKPGHFPGDASRGAYCCSYTNDWAPVPRGGGKRRLTSITVRRCGPLRFQVRIAITEDERSYRTRQADANLPPPRRLHPGEYGMVSAILDNMKLSIFWARLHGVDDEQLLLIARRYRNKSVGEHIESAYRASIQIRGIDPSFDRFLARSLAPVPGGVE